MDDSKQIMILGIGNILLTDEGFGVRVIERINERYAFPENVSIVEGGVLGINLLGYISDSDYMIVVDAIRNNGEPGTLYRIDNDDISNRVHGKNSLHQIDFLETLAMCRYGLEKAPETVIFGVEPKDIESYGVELTPPIQAKVDEMIEKIMAHLDQMGVPYEAKGAAEYVPCNSL